MSVRLEKLQEIPPGGYRYKDPSTGKTIIGPTYHDWVMNVKRHKVANNVPVTAFLEADMQEQLCEQLPPGWCVRDGQMGGFEGLDFTRVLNGTATLVEWFKAGRQKVSRQHAQGRANICGGCPNNRSAAGCSSCNTGKILNLVNQIVGGETLDGEGALHACTLCGCSLKAKVWLEPKLLQANSGTMEWPTWCWMRKEKE